LNGNVGRSAIPQRNSKAALRQGVQGQFAGPENQNQKRGKQERVSVIGIKLAGIGKDGQESRMIAKAATMSTPFHQNLRNGEGSGIMSSERITRQRGGAVESLLELDAFRRGDRLNL
jgi:hypothetical protein